MKKNKIVAKQEEPQSSCFHLGAKNEIEKYVLDLLPKITEVYGLEETTFFIDTYTSTHKDCEEDKDGNVIFTINYRDTYRTAYIAIHPLAIRIYKRGQMGMFKHALVHEVAHLITEPLADLAASRYVTGGQIRDSVERTTESIAMIARKLLSKIDSQTFEFNK